jgi:hypothetical protein
VRTRVRITGNGSATFYFGTKAEPWISADKISDRFPLVGDGAWHEYTVAIKNPKWTGELSTIRLDFDHFEPGTQVAVSEITLTSGAKDLASFDFKPAIGLFSIDWLSLERAGAPIHFPLPGCEGLPRDPLVKYRPIERTVPDTASVLPRKQSRPPRGRRLAERDGSHPGGTALAAVLPVTNGLVLWLRSDRGVETDAKGRVRQWNDLSGHGYHAKQLYPSA